MAHQAEELAPVGQMPILKTGPTPPIKVVDKGQRFVPGHGKFSQGRIDGPCEPALTVDGNAILNQKTSLFLVHLPSIVDDTVMA